MEKVPRGKRASENQKEFLVNFLEENVDVANDKFVTVDGAKFREQKWKELAMSLNAIGGTQKDGQKWRKYWSDLRHHTRAKYADLKKAEMRSGVNGLGRLKTLSPLEERVIKLTTEEAVDGDGTPEVGFEISSVLSIVCEDEGQPEIIVTDATLAADAVTTSSAASTSTAATITTTSLDATAPATATSSTSGNTGSGTANRLQSQRRKLQPEAPQIEKFFKLEEKMLEEMRAANDLKKEQLAILKQQVQATKEQTEAIKEQRKAQENVATKLQQYMEILLKK